MSFTNAQIDANFYQMIHQVVQSSADKAEDRRGHKRQRYSEFQWIAPWDGFGFPAEFEFMEVPCYDLTRGGFSFLYTKRPEFKMLVAGFGQKPKLLFVGAEVLRSTPVLVFASGRMKRLGNEETSLEPFGRGDEPGVARMLVGCRFIRRLRPWPSMGDRH